MDYGAYFQAQLEERIRSFESNLLEWIRDESNTAALLNIEQIFTHLSAMDRRESFRKLWWLGSGLAEAVRYDAIRDNDTAKKLFARLIRELRAQRHRDGIDRRHAPAQQLFDDLLEAFTDLDSDDTGPILRHVTREFSRASDLPAT